MAGGVLTKPVFYGRAPENSLQDYALTANHYEDGQGEITAYYGKNETRIKVVKQDADEKVPIQGAHFDLYDESKNIIHTDLVSNEKGEIILNDILPGKYYLRETIAPSGYDIYEDYIPIEIKFNETFSVIVNDQKEQAPEFETGKNGIEVEKAAKKEITEEVVGQVKPKEIKLPKTGM